MKCIFRQGYRQSRGFHSTKAHWWRWVDLLSIWRSSPYPHFMMIRHVIYESTGYYKAAKQLSSAAHYRGWEFHLNRPQSHWKSYDHPQSTMTCTSEITYISRRFYFPIQHNNCEHVTLYFSCKGASAHCAQSDQQDPHLFRFIDSPPCFPNQLGLVPSFWDMIDVSTTFVPPFRGQLINLLIIPVWSICCSVTVQLTLWQILSGTMRRH